MKILILLSAFFVISTSSFSQDSLELRKPFFSYLYNIEEIAIVQNTCKSNMKVKLSNSFLDSIACRTDSIFNTDSPKYFHLRSYDTNNILRFNASIHLHVKSSAYFSSDEKEILVSPLYQNCLSIENYIEIDKDGKLIESMIDRCDFYNFPNFDEFGMDEFGTKTTIKYDQIKRMPLDR